MIPLETTEDEIKQVRELCSAINKLLAGKTMKVSGAALAVIVGKYLAVTPEELREIALERHLHIATDYVRQLAERDKGKADEKNEG